MSDYLTCTACAARYAIDVIRYECTCGSLLAVERDDAPSVGPRDFDARRASGRGLDASGVWTFREAVLADAERDAVSHPEGCTRLYEREALASFADVDRVWFKHEGENPTGSFKDRGMTVAITAAARLGAKIVACASTGNTSSSLAAYAAQAGLTSVVFLPEGKVTSGKLAQTLAYGAHCLAVRGDFDTALRLAREAAQTGSVYLVNSINPFRIEGQKTIIWELLADLDWQPPDWIVVPGGNLGNLSAFGKALGEALRWGWIQKLPRLAVIQAEGANPFYQSYKSGFSERLRVVAETVATAIRIGDPVNHPRATQSITRTNGVVEQVTDAELMEAKGRIDRCGIGCEPASATTLAGLRKLRAVGTIGKHERVACILTGHVLKDPDVLLGDAFGAANRARITAVDGTHDAIARELSRL
jgi:threonine synthase